MFVASSLKRTEKKDFHRFLFIFLFFLFVWKMRIRVPEMLMAKFNCHLMQLAYLSLEQYQNTRTQKDIIILI